MGPSLLTQFIAAQRYQQGFHFVNCGADIVALTSSMSAEVQRVKALTSEETATRMKDVCSIGNCMENINGTGHRNGEIKLY